MAVNTEKLLQPTSVLALIQNNPSLALYTFPVATNSDNNTKAKQTMGIISTNVLYLISKHILFSVSSEETVL